MFFTKHYRPKPKKLKRGQQHKRVSWFNTFIVARCGRTRTITLPSASAWTGGPIAIMANDGPIVAVTQHRDRLVSSPHARIIDGLHGLSRACHNFTLRMNDG